MMIIMLSLFLSFSLSHMHKHSKCHHFLLKYQIWFGKLLHFPTNDIHGILWLSWYFFTCIQSDSSSAPVPMPKPRQVTPPTPGGGAPVPLKRKNSPGSAGISSSSSGRPPIAAKTGAHTTTAGQHPSLRAKMSSELPPLPQKDSLSSSSAGYPALPPKSPDPSSTSPPAIPRRQGVSKFMFIIHKTSVVVGTYTCTFLVMHAINFYVLPDWQSLNLQSL